MKFCSACGASLILEIPEGDNRERHVCGQCETIHYVNPKNVVGCLLSWQGRILLCKRAIEPRSGYWTLPAGFMENGESTQQGAAREAFEEAHAQAQDLQLFGVYNLPRISQVYIMFSGVLKDGFAEAGEESLEVRLFDEDEIPWQELAFPVVVEALQRYYEQRNERVKKVYLADIHSRPGSKPNVTRLN